MTDDCLWSGGSWRRILSHWRENRWWRAGILRSSGVDRRHIDRLLLSGYSRTGQDEENEMKLTPIALVLEFVATPGSAAGQRGRLRIAPRGYTDKRISGFEEVEMMNSWMEKIK